MAVLCRTVLRGLRRTIGWFFWGFTEVFERRNAEFWDSPVAVRDAIAGILGSLVEAARTILPIEQYS